MAGKRKTFWGKLLLWFVVAGALVMILSVIVRSLSDPNRVRDAEERCAYLSALGWEVSPEEETEQIIHIPQVFPDVLKEYNELQKKQGFDLHRFAGKEILLFTYTVKNYPGEDTVECCLYVYKNRVIGGDVHSTSFTGFMCGILPGYTKNG